MHIGRDNRIFEQATEVASKLALPSTRNRFISRSKEHDTSRLLPLLLIVSMFTTLIEPASAIESQGTQAQKTETQSKSTTPKESTTVAGSTASSSSSSSVGTESAQDSDPVVTSDDIEVSEEDSEEEESVLDESGKSRKPIIIKPGQSISITTASHEIRVTNDVTLAKEQAQEFPDSPEASFILAVALTRTSRVEEALMEVRKARKLSMAKGGAAYFDDMIHEYEKVLEHKPDDTSIKYHLAWAYYMKAYVLTKYSKRVVADKKSATASGAMANLAPPKDWHKEWVNQASEAQKEVSQSQTASVEPAGSSAQTIAGQAAAATSTGDNSSAPKATKKTGMMAYAWENAAPEVIPQIKKYYRRALSKLDSLLVQDPEDLWATLYRAHLKAEYNGDIDAAMNVWRNCQKKFPSNPAPYFFLGEGYLKKGNLRESLTNVSKAIALRGLGY